MEETVGLGKARKPLITPEEFLQGQDVDVSRYKLKSALLAFMSISGMADKFTGKMAPTPVLSHTREHPLIRDDGTILVGQVYGGPYCSIVLEELSVFGVKYAVGYGFSGTLDNNITPGTIMIAESSFCSDAISKLYTRDSEVHADTEMLESLKDLSQAYGLTPNVGKVWTVDALYRYYPSTATHWRKKGAKFVNLETASFYAVARSKGIKAVYLSVVSDIVHGQKWSGWSVDLEKAIDKMWEISLEMIDML
jgi:purine-nucleoside phosphorylase